MMLKKSYRYLLFDLDRTLWDFDSNARNNIYQLLVYYNLSSVDKDLFHSAYNTINHRLWADYESGRLSKEILRTQRFYLTLKEFDIDDRELAYNMGERYLEQMPYQQILMPYAFEVLSRLRSLGIKMAIVSNGFKEVQYKKIEYSGIGSFFDAILISEEQGVHKPSPIIFKRALNAIQGNKNEALMVGDDIVNDIEGAMIFGIDQFYYNYNNAPCESNPTYNSNDLRELIWHSAPQ